MQYNPEIHHRLSIRLKGYDYSSDGTYFVTICVQNRQCLFGDVAHGEMNININDAGKMVEHGWLELSNKFPSIEMDAYVVMPNHFHGILTIVGADLRVRPDPVRLNPVDPGFIGSNAGAHIGAPLPKILQWFKTMTTNEYIRSIKKFNWPSFTGR